MLYVEVRGWHQQGSWSTALEKYFLDSSGSLISSHRLYSNNIASIEGPKIVASYFLWGETWTTDYIRYICGSYTTSPKLHSGFHCGCYLITSRILKSLIKRMLRTRSVAAVRLGSVRSPFFPNTEPDPRFGSANFPNPEPDRRFRFGSGSNRFGHWIYFCAQTAWKSEDFGWKWVKGVLSVCQNMFTHLETGAPNFYLPQAEGFNEHFVLLS